MYQLRRGTRVRSSVKRVGTTWTPSSSHTCWGGGGGEHGVQHSRAGGGGCVHEGACFYTCWGRWGAQKALGCCCGGVLCVLYAGRAGCCVGRVSGCLCVGVLCGGAHDRPGPCTGPGHESAWVLVRAACQKVRGARQGPCCMRQVQALGCRCQAGPRL